MDRVPCPHTAYSLIDIIIDYYKTMWKKCLQKILCELNNNENLLSTYYVLCSGLGNLHELTCLTL